MGGLRDRVALVTGASSGIGRAIALALAAEGAGVCLVGRRADALADVARTARAAGGATVRTYVADLTADGSIGTLVGSVRGDVATLDILIHSAGVFTFDPIDRARVEALDEQYRTSVRAAYQLTQHTLTMLRASSGGDIVFVNSTAALGARAGLAPYAAARGALKALADGVREEVNADGVRVLTIFVGRTATPMQAAVHAAEGRPYHPDRLVQPADVATMVLAALAAPRTAEVTELTIRPVAKLR